MISVTVECDRKKRIRAFTATDHGKSEVCAAVSLMVLNTVNSIEALTDEPFSTDFYEEGGLLRFIMENPPKQKSRLLLESMLLGLRQVKDKYPEEIEIKEIEWKC